MKHQVVVGLHAHVWEPGPEASPREDKGQGCRHPLFERIIHTADVKKTTYRVQGADMAGVEDKADILCHVGAEPRQLVPMT